MSFEELRRNTLINLKKASEEMLGKTEEDIEALQVTFQSDNGSNSFPYWHMINGPIADALYHTGQVVSFRRANGNPINPNISQFMGKKRN